MFLSLLLLLDHIKILFPKQRLEGLFMKRIARSVFNQRETNAFAGPLGKDALFFITRQLPECAVSLSSSFILYPSLVYTSPAKQYRGSSQITKIQPSDGSMYSEFSIGFLVSCVIELDVLSTDLHKCKLSLLAASDLDRIRDAVSCGA